MIQKLKSLLGPRNPLRLGWHYAKAFVAALRYGFPARKLTVIGITGTDGKTTTVCMTAHILQRAGIPTGALSTAYLRIKDQQEWNETQKTSPSPFMIQKFLRSLVRAGCTHAVLEVSSHGLVQGRTHYTWPSIAAITNISMEHLDYHGTLEQYRADKGLLFESLRGKGTKVLNADDESYRMYLNIRSERTISFANHPVDIPDSLWLDAISLTPESGSATLHQGDQSMELNVKLPGGFNLENALCASAAAVAAGASIEDCAAALRSFKGAPGRMEPIEEGQPFSVYVDFTVTPVAYEKTLSTLREVIGPDKRILVLAGSCGDRMREKRPLVGKICSELADVVIVANEDPYTEDPQKIIDEVWAGIDQAKCEAQQIFDRKEAIRSLFARAQPGDAVLLCGKGSDTTMWVKEGQIPWNEREIARELLRNRSAGSATCADPRE